MYFLATPILTLIPYEGYDDEHDDEDEELALPDKIGKKNQKNFVNSKERRMMAVDPCGYPHQLF